jgi:hypothetical protein
MPPSMFVGGFGVIFIVSPSAALIGQWFTKYSRLRSYSYTKQIEEIESIL